MPLRRWFDDGSLTVSDWHCRGEALGTGPEERAPACEISIGRAGSHAIRTADGDSVVDCTQLLCVNAGEVFRSVRSALGLERRTRIALAPHAMRDLAGSGDRESRFRCRTAPLTARGALAHHALLRHVQTDTRDELAIHTVALALLHHAWQPRSPSRAEPATPAVREAVRAVQELLAHRHAEPLTLTALAAYVGLSPWHLSRRFRVHVGVGLHQYRTRLRLLSALDRLGDSRRPDLARIAFDVGFSSHSHFTREFRAFFRLPPSRIRGDPALPRTGDRRERGPRHP